MRDSPPVWLGVGDADPLIEDSRLFAAQLASTGRPHELAVYPGMPHGFSAYADIAPGAAAATRDAARFLEKVLSNAAA